MQKHIRKNRLVMDSVCEEERRDGREDMEGTNDEMRNVRELYKSNPVCDADIVQCIGDNFHGFKILPDTHHPDY